MPFMVATLDWIHGLGTALGVFRGEAVAMSFSGSVVLLLFVGWLWLDGIERRWWPAYHYGLALYALWWILMPHYLWRTRGVHGLGIFALLLLALGARGLGALLGTLILMS